MRKAKALRQDQYETFNDWWVSEEMSKLKDHQGAQPKQKQYQQLTNILKI